MCEEVDAGKSSNRMWRFLPFKHVFASFCRCPDLHASSPSDLLHGHIQHLYHASGGTNHVSGCCHVRLSCYGIIQLHQWVRSIINLFSPVRMHLKSRILTLRNAKGESAEMEVSLVSVQDS